jgi:hypothetical protein
MSTLTLTLLIAIPCILIIAGIITTIIILKKRNK